MSTGGKTSRSSRSSTWTQVVRRGRSGGALRYCTRKKDIVKTLSLLYMVMKLQLRSAYNTMDVLRFVSMCEIGHQGCILQTYPGMNQKGLPFVYIHMIGSAHNGHTGNERYRLALSD